MQYYPTKFKDAWLIKLAPARDERGFFARTFCVDEFSDRDLETNFPQHSISFSAKRGTLRGMHFNREPHAEIKVVRCVRGKIWDVIVDIRESSPTFLHWQGFDLSTENGCQLYIPKGFAHGFQTLTDDVEVTYLISARYVPEAACGLRYDDRSINIIWPLPISVISDKDRSWPDFSPYMK
jgi:dTDP-4-dehydrorhamnose 3,5-epimerase